jgi:3,4-dihydroxy 2-butanone 4-phosphate synthase/GTP cyclohydrolase II
VVLFDTLVTVTGMSSPSASQPGSAAGDPAVRRVARTTLPTDAGDFDLNAYVAPDGQNHLALVMGDVSEGSPGGPPLVRLHSECLTGDALGSHRCDCGDQLRAAQRAIAEEGRGVVVYLRGHEGRGIGLIAKLHAYALQDGGLDTVDANLALGLPADMRSYRPAVAVLKELGVQRVRLLSSNPVKEEQLRDGGIDVVERIVLPVPARPENRHYLEAKRSRMGHAAPRFTGETWRELLAGRTPAGAAEVADTELVERYGPLVAAGPRLVLAQLGQSLDGFIAARTGDSSFVTGEQDRAHLHRLRALVDAVVVGVGTVVADDCRLTVRAVEGQSPVRVLLDPSARAPRTAAVLTDGEAPTLWCVATHSPAPGPVAAHVQVLRLPAIDGRFPPRDVLAGLAARGLSRVLVEGGGCTVSGFLAAEVLDRIFLTIAPVLIGDGVPGLRFSGADRLSDALRAPSRRFVLGEDVCFELDLAASRRAGAVRDRLVDPPDLGQPDADPDLVAQVARVLGAPVPASARVEEHDQDSGRG